MIKNGIPSIKISRKNGVYTEMNVNAPKMLNISVKKKFRFIFRKREQTTSILQTILD